MFDILEADIVIMQEAKIQRKDLTDDMVLVNGWDVFFSLPRDKKGEYYAPFHMLFLLTPIPGYSGVAIYTRNSKCCPIRAEEGITGVLCAPKSSIKFRDLPVDQQIGGYPRLDQLLGPIDDVMLDSEGRTVILEFPAFVLIGVYVPATRDDTRTDFRIGFLGALDARIRNLVAMGKQVILAGDLNVIRTDIDTAGCAEHLRKEGMTMDDFLSLPSRRLFNQLIFEGQVIGERDEGREKPVIWDMTRTFHPNRQGMFTCWETKKNARPGNYGSRIDYILCTTGIKGWFEDCNIQEGLIGSDHCPVYAILADRVKQGGEECSIDDLMNPEGMFKESKRLREWSTKDLLPQSAKLLTEFDRRRSIKDMFTKKPAASKLDQAATDTTVAESNTSANLTSDTRDFITAPSPTPSATAATETSTTSMKLPSIIASPTSLTRGSTDGSSTSNLKSPRSIASPTAPTKRAASAATTQPSKKAKTAAAKDKAKPGPMQSSLKGFFKPKSPAPTKTQEEKQDEGGSSVAAAISRPPPLASSPSTKKPIASSSQLDGAVAASDEEVGAAPESAAGGDSGMAADEERVFDPIESKESWSKLLGKKRAAPPCEHGEPCISYVTKKPGFNTGEYPPPESNVARCVVVTGRWVCIGAAARYADAGTERQLPPRPAGTDVLASLGGAGALGGPPDLRNTWLTFYTRPLVLHVLATAGTVGTEGERDAMAVRDVHLAVGLEGNLRRGEVAKDIHDGPSSLV